MTLCCCSCWCFHSCMHWAGWLVVLGIQDVPGSNLNRDRDYPDKLFIVLFSPSRQIPRRYITLGHGHLYPHPYLFITHSHPITPCYTVPVTDDNVKQVQINA